MSQLRVLILGSPEVFWDADAVKIPRRIPRTMLYYLATFSLPIDRATMFSAFWPELDEEAARNSFRDNLGKLRSALPDPDLIQTDNFSIKLDTSQVFIDYQEFLNILNQANRDLWQIPNDQSLPEQMYLQLAHAANLWRSPNLLQGARLPNSQVLDEWLTLTEQNLNHKRDLVLNRLIHHCISKADYEASIYWLEKAIESDLLNESLHLLKIETLLKSGRNNEAIKYGQYVEELFSKEYNEKPSHQLTTLIQKIKTEQVQINLNHRQYEENLTNMDAPFIGRQKELKEMDLAYHKDSVILVEGEIGIGKTRLIHEFNHRFETPHRLLVIPCHTSSPGIPYQPLIEMIRSGVTQEEIRSLKEFDKKLLAQIDPSFQGLMNIEIQVNTDGYPDNYPWLQETFFHLLQQISKKQKVLLLLDHAQSVDDATMSTISYMFQNNLFSSKACLVITCETDRSNPFLRKFLDELILQKRLKKIQLGPLLPDEVMDLVRSISGKSDINQLLKKIEEDIGGNPLMVIECIRLNALESQKDEGKNSIQQIPASIQEILHQKFQELTPVMQTILSVTALSGPFIRFDILEATTQLPLDKIVDGLEELEKKNILQSSEETVHAGLTYSFRQNIFRNVILSEISATRKRLLHRRIAAALESLSLGLADTHSSILAGHYEASGDLEKAFHYWEKSANFAKKLGAPGDAYNAFSRADALIPAIEMQLSDHDLASFYNGWADISYKNHDPKHLTAIHIKLMSLGEKRNSATLLGTGLSIQAINQFSINHFAEGLVIIEQALRYFKDCDNLSAWLNCMARKSKFLYMLSRFEESCQVIEQALAIQPDTNDEEVLHSQALLYYDYATVLTLMGYPLRGVEQAEQSLQLYVKTRDIEGQAKVYGMLVLANSYCGQTIRAETEGQMGIQLAIRINYIRMQGYIHVYLALTKVSRGKMDEAWNHATQAQSIGEKYGYSEITTLSLRTIGDIYRYLGNNIRAMEYYQKSLDISTDAFSRCDSLSRLGYLKSITGDEAHGMSMIREAQIESEKMSLGSVAISSQLYQYIIQNTEENLNKNKDEIINLSTESEKRGLTAQWGVCLSLLARLDFLHGDPEKAEEKIARLLKKGEQFEGLWASVLIQVLYDEAEKYKYFGNNFRRSQAQELLTLLENNCKNPVLRPSFIQFKSNIDKMIKT
jgi:DNA-binding SARP family transcriptional activator